MEIKNIKKLQNGSDVRGIAQEGIAGETVNFTQDMAMKIAFSFATWLEKKSGKTALTFAIGRDSRLSGENLAQAVALGLVSKGNKVYQCGIATTPAMFMTTLDPVIQADGAVMVTASHLPFNRNGLKFFTRDGGLDKADITEILALAETIETDFTPGGKTLTYDFLPSYANHIVNIIREKTGKNQPLAGAAIVVDAGNGAGGFFVEQVLVPLGANTKGSLYLDPDGSFPNHVPNPEDATAIDHISRAVLNHHADLGIIFDTDVDRAAIIDEKGNAINRNGFIAFIASMVLSDYPGSTIVTDSITSTGLTEYIESLGGKHHRFKRGYKNVINEAIQLNSQGIETHLAMETSGHGAIKENYFLDDGAYLVTMALIKFAELHQVGKPISSFLKGLKEPAEAKEIRFKIAADDFKAYGERVLAEFKTFAANQPGWTIVNPNYEGVRISCDTSAGNGWCLLRMSLHDPIMPLNIESDSVGGCEIIETVLKQFLAQYQALG
ncbi:phosphohexomutase domain-containing protein [Acetobacterium woodii]|uniref:Phosphoglucomutase Pgm2 n=1 Tax=Acetobacterium woodii (strain ATCC 29683 / DSM 1030 / JCM 2381 / KCTC 1655 / WB1) TaxID=931626 RepID=H6LBA2_ACEWD|nr:phosphoglucomutase [Acetobacterium woodii]AFA47654.1 phosphoglucomutase Pgm2 [Acetobacterium woodii DSM 1030]